MREHTRDSAELKITLNAAVAAKLQADKNMRVMIYCAADNGLNQYAKSDIAFPHQVEIKANLDEVKANLRGLKNKPGSTRPADITNFIRKKPGYPNHVVMTYALTQKVSTLCSIFDSSSTLFLLLAMVNYPSRSSLCLQILFSGTLLRSLCQGSRQGKPFPGIRCFARVRMAHPIRSPRSFNYPLFD